MSDLRTGLLLRGASTATGDDVLQKAELCAKLLAESRRLVVLQHRSPVLAQLLAHARELLEELDVALLALSHDRDTGVFTQLTVQHETLAELELWLRTPSMIDEADHEGTVVTPSSSRLDTVPHRE